MKKLIIIAISAFLSINTFAQQIDLRKKISVSGTAEKEVTPDEIYINISLKEYLKDNNAKKKIDITTLENQLYNALLTAKIAKENLSIDNLSSWNYNYERKKNVDFLASKQYTLKLSDLNKYNEILAAIDPKGIQSTSVDRFEYSKAESMKKELKIKAIQTARDKATYLVEAVGEKLGGALDIQEISNDGNAYYQPQYRQAKAMMLEVSGTVADSASAPEIEIKKMKLTYTVNVVFEIK
ncbi:MAG: SIMPL domain-containing protein [Sphingobacteriaceae bacterium]|nr:SIMPL domain-containing protein [Sphingobacteriaceae bacterium]